MLKNAAWLVTMCAGLAFLAAPAFAVDMPKKAEAHGKMHHGMRHKMTCYDYAWESQAQKDCLAKPEGEQRPMHHARHHHRMKKPMDKPMEKKS
ncbi:MAG TPA: hypothetical protein VIJ42_08360 [Stellaceae bacterium]